MSKLRSKFIAMLAVLFCALLCFSMALFIPKTKTAEATAISGDVVKLDNNGKFSAKALRKLYGNITKSTDVITYEKLSDKLGTTPGTVLKKYSEMTPTTVELGGLKWNLVAVSRSQLKEGQTEGDIVATIWLAESFYNSNYAYSNFSSWTAWKSYFPAEYSMSVVRTTLVGGNYATGVEENNIASGTQNPTWTTFLADYGSYIDTPYQVCGTTGYQATQKASESYCGSGTNDLNDAYTPVEGNFTYAGVDYYGYQYYTNYGKWQDDKLWIPSLCETGQNNITAEPPYTDATGLWGIDNATVKANVNLTWRRSSVGNIPCIPANGAWSNGYAPYLAANSFGVRPALHLNLRAAAEDAKGVSFDDVEASSNVTESTKKITYGETAHTFSHVYDGTTASFTINQHANLREITSSDYSSDASYSGGIFTSGKYPEEDKAKTYEIKVKPKVVNGESYVWDDTDTSEERTYKIEITLADMEVGWEGFDGSLGDSLLLPDSEITVKGNSADSPLTVRYYIVAPGEPDSPPANTSEWTLKTDSTDPKVEAAGSYRVYYEITAKYHNPEKNSYYVSVGVEKVKITANGSAGSAAYFEGGVESLSQENWISKIKSAITVTKDGAAYDSVDTLLGNLKVVFSTKSGNSYSEATKNGQGYYNVGTYYLDLKFKDGANQSVQFEWANSDRPTFEITKMTITVKVIAASEDGELTHVYGDNHAAMKIVMNNGSTTLPDGGAFADIFGDYILKTDDEEIVLDKTTPVGEGKVIADTSGIKNYEVKFETSSSEYEVTQKKVTLKVTDESTGYGTDFTKYKFKSLKFDDGESLANNETLDEVIKTITYSIKSSAGIVNLYDILVIGEYELNATATADNYIFEIKPGKLTITKGNYDMSGVTLSNAGYIYNGQPHPAKLDGELPSEDIKDSYRYVNYNTGEELDGPPVEVGLYLVYVTFSHENTNYNPITDVLAAYIRIAYTQDELNEPYPPIPSDSDLAAAADLAKKKSEAKKSLDEEAQAKKAEIDADSNLTAEEKQAAKSEIDSELAAGNAAIDSAKDANGVNSAYNDGKKEIDDTADLAKKKGEAKKSLENAAKAKKDEIDANEELTDEEKEEAKAKVDAELASGKDAIDGATDANGVQSAQSTSKTNIENIKGIHKGNSSFPWWIIIVVAGVLLLLAVLIIIIVKRRQVADGDDDYDDFYDDEYDFDEDIEEEYDDGEEF